MKKKTAWFFVGLATVFVTAATLRSRPAPAAGAEDINHEALENRIKALEGLIPDQAHIMADVSEHFTNLWFAGTAENWPLADFYLNETKSHLHWAVRRIPVRKDSRGRDVNLVNILDAFEKSQLTQLKQVIDHKNKDGFERIYKETLTACYACHKASDKPFLRPRVPDEPASRVINFDPNANWPL